MPWNTQEPKVEKVLKSYVFEGFHIGNNVGCGYRKQCCRPPPALFRNSRGGTIHIGTQTLEHIGAKGGEGIEELRVRRFSRW